MKAIYFDDNKILFRIVSDITLHPILCFFLLFSLLEEILQNISFLAFFSG